MYDHYDDPWFTPSYPSVHPQSDVVTHLVFVGGRLAETWSEQAADGPYAEFARSLALERQRVEPAPTPAVPVHVRLLEWLDEQAGGRDSLLALGGEPLGDDDTGVPTAERSSDQQRLLAVAELLDGCANVLLHVEEWGNACRRALVTLWELDREAVSLAPSASHVAAGIVWAVGKANGWFPGSGHAICTQSQLRDHFGLTAYPSAYGKSVQAALRVTWPSVTAHPDWRRPITPELEALGRPDLLTARTRRTLLRLRDQALASARIAESGELDEAS